MADERCTASVIMLPTAARGPVVNPKRRGRFPSNVVPLWKLRNLRLARKSQEERDHAARLQLGMVVKISSRESKNFGRLCRIVRADGDNWWSVEPLAGLLLMESGTCSDRASVHFSWLEPHGAARSSAH